MSHTHAQLTLDHDRWYIEDLGSTNGTYVGMPGDALPTTPLLPHNDTSLLTANASTSARCRIQIRKATDAERHVP